MLAGRKTVGTIDGAIAFAGVKPTPEFLRRYTGYVEQFGAPLPGLFLLLGCSTTLAAGSADAVLCFAPKACLFALYVCVLI